MSTTATPVAMHWIDGRWADSDEHRDSVNPATGQVIGSYAIGGPKEAQAAIEAAKRAFAVMDDFIEFKHIRLRLGTTPAV
jgi:betaine-aldehyde dehydrogenase